MEGRRPSLRVRPFTDEYEALASLSGSTADELRRTDASRTTVRRRWIAWSGDDAVAAVTALSRPDDRVFLAFTPTPATPVVAALADAVAARLPGRCCVAVDDGAVESRRAFEDAGFVIENTADAFRVRFDRALGALGRPRMPSGVRIVPADEVDEGALFELDSVLRRDVPGTDGWRGNRQWFLDELSDAPPFDAAAYRVAIEPATDAYLGLARVWRNPAEPRFGLVGVVRRARRSLVAAALTRTVLEAASRWGSATFVTETATTNRAIHPRLLRMDAEHLGRSLQMVRASSA